MKNIYFVIVSLMVGLYILYSIRKNNISIKTSFTWIIISIGMLFLSIFPKSLDFISTFLGISYAPTLFLTLCIVVLAVMNFDFSKNISKQQEQIYDLEQEIAILEEKINEKK